LSKVNGETIPFGNGLPGYYKFRDHIMALTFDPEYLGQIVEVTIAESDGQVYRGEVALGDKAK
jgi:hypothetical protein